MSRDGNHHDNAAAESSFNRLGREPICRQISRSRLEARQDPFDDIEMLQNPERKHIRKGMLPPSEFEWP